MQPRELEYEDVPPTVTPGLLSRACGWTWKKARGELERAGILKKRGKALCASRRALKERMPDEYDCVFAYCVQGVRPRPPRRRPKMPQHRRSSPPGP